MESFDAMEALRLIEEHKVTVSQWVPSMFVRMFKLSDEERNRYDLSSLKRSAIHAAAPCPHSGQGEDDRLVGTGVCSSTTRAPRATASRRSTPTSG